MGSLTLGPKVASPQTPEVFDVTFGIWVLSIHPYTDLAEPWN